MASSLAASSVSASSHGSGGSTARKSRWGTGSPTPSAASRAPPGARPPSARRAHPARSWNELREIVIRQGPLGRQILARGAPGPSRSERGSSRHQGQSRGSSRSGRRGSVGSDARGSSRSGRRGSVGSDARSETSSQASSPGPSGARRQSPQKRAPEGPKAPDDPLARWDPRVPRELESEAPEAPEVAPEDSVLSEDAMSVDALLRGVKERLRGTASSPLRSVVSLERSGVTPASSPPRSVPQLTLSAGAPKPPLPPPSSRLSLDDGSQPRRPESSRAPSAARIESSLALVQQPGGTLSRALQVPLSEVQFDPLLRSTEGMKRALATVRAAEHSLNDHIVEYTRRLESRVDMAHRSEERLNDELRERTKELLEAQLTLEACHSEIEGQRASAAAEVEYRNALMFELTKANEAIVSIKDEQQVLEDEIQQARDQLSARHAELQQARDELRACREGTSAARLRGEDLEERLAGLQQAEATLQAEIVDTQTALQGKLGMARTQFEDAHAELATAREELARNERELRDELAQVQAELGAAKAELQRRQKCCFRLRSKKAAAPKEAEGTRAVLTC